MGGEHELVRRGLAGRVGVARREHRRFVRRRRRRRDGSVNFVGRYLNARCSNNYGPYQFPEKLIPLMILNAFDAQPLPVYGDGLQVREWIHVDDHCAAVDAILLGGTGGGVYNVATGDERRNLDIVRAIVRLAGGDESLIRHVADRPGHDRRYAMNTAKIRAQLGWRPQRAFDEGLADTVAWYRANQAWTAGVRSGAYREYYRRQYADRLADPSP